MVCGAGKTILEPFSPVLCLSVFRTLCACVCIRVCVRLCARVFMCVFFMCVCVCACECMCVCVWQRVQGIRVLWHATHQGFTANLPFPLQQQHPSPVPLPPSPPRAPLAMWGSAAARAQHPCLVCRRGAVVSNPKGRDQPTTRAPQRHARMSPVRVRDSTALPSHLRIKRGCWPEIELRYSGEKMKSSWVPHTSRAAIPLPSVTTRNRHRSHPAVSGGSPLRPIPTSAMHRGTAFLC